MEIFILWLKSIIGYWQIWASGSGLLGFGLLLIYLSERLGGWTMPKKWYAFTLLFLFTIGSSFMAWRDMYVAFENEHKKVIQLTKELNVKQKNKEIRKELSSFLSQATVIQVHCEQYPIDKSCYPEFKDWNEKLHKYLDENLDHTYSTILEDNDPVIGPPLPNIQNSRTWGYVQQRKRHLREFIEKFE